MFPTVQSSTERKPPDTHGSLAPSCSGAPERKEGSMISITPEELVRRTRRSALIAERIGTLPAVPTLDWPARAASTLTPVGDGSIVAVLIVSLSHASCVRQVHACHAAAHPSQPGDVCEPLTRRLRTLPTLGPIYDAKRPPVMALARDPVAESNPLMALMGDAAPGGLLVGHIELGARSRSMLVLVAPARARAGELAELTGVLPVLARRATMALGSTTAGPASWLTQREQVVLESLTQGLSVRQIAEHLARSPHTIHDHVKSLHRKLGATNRGGLIARALGHADQLAEPHADHADAPAHDPLRLIDAKPMSSSQQAHGPQSLDTDTPRAARAIGLDQPRALPKAV